MDIDCELRLRWTPAVVTEKQQQEVTKRWGILPTTVCFWIDPYWEGQWVNGTIEKGGEMLFHIRYTMKRMPDASLRDSSLGMQWLNPTVKVQFFMPLDPKRDTRMPDFRYSATFPVEVLLRPKGEAVCGLWNQNDHVCNQMSPQYLPYVKLHVRTVRASRLPITTIMLPSDMPLPSFESHQDVFTFAEWLDHALGQVYPKVDSIFFMARSIGRNPFQDFIFTEAQAMYQTEGTNLPPLLGLYALCNALIVHGLTLDAAERLILNGGPSNKAQVTRLLGLMRDVLMCFTFCPREGQYRDDMCVGQIVEDQPQCLQFTPPDWLQTIFGKDDCEGLGQQGGVHMVELFRAMALDVHRNGGKKVHNHLARNVESSPLQVQPETRKRLLSLAVAIGEMFLDGRLESQLCEGETMMSKLSPNAAHLEPGAPPEGHSFGMLLYEHGFLKGAVLMENTGIEYVREVPPTRFEKEAAAGLAHIAQRHSRVFGTRVTLMHKDEDYLYQRICLGKGVMFFTQRCIPHHQHNDGVVLEYGTSPSLVNTNFVRYDGSPLPRPHEGEAYAVLVPMDKLLEGLRDGTGPWPRVQGADEMCRLFAKLRREYQGFARIWMPPQDTEGEYISRMNRWGKIHEQDLLRMSSVHSGEQGRLLATAVRIQANDAAPVGPPREFQDWLVYYGNRIRVFTHPFMYSTIYLIFEKKEESASSSVVGESRGRQPLLLLE
jgi:hypothetical protein